MHADIAFTGPRLSLGIRLTRNTSQHATTRFRWPALWVVPLYILGCIPRLALAQQDTQCQANEVLVAITIDHQPLDNLEFLDLSILGPRFTQVEEEGSSNNNNTSGDTFNFYQRLLGSESTDSTTTVPVEVSVCVPADECLVVMIQVNATTTSPTDDSTTTSTRYELSPDEISIIYNGQVAVSNLQGPFPYGPNGVMVAGEIGDASCEVACFAGELLLEIQAATGSVANYDWHVYDDLTGEMIAHCPPAAAAAADSSGNEGNATNSKCYWTRNQFYTDRLCVVNDGCYTLVIGQMYLDKNNGSDGSVMNVTLDGNSLAMLENPRYASIKLNDESTRAKCVSSGCNEDSRPLEMFVFRDYVPNLRNNLTWTVSTVEEDEQVLAINNVSFGDRALYYHQACIPNPSSCIQFQLYTPPETLENSNAAWNVTYRLVLDGITYADTDLETILEPLLLVGNCSATQPCSVDTAAVQVDLLTGPTWQVGDFPFEITESSSGGMIGLYQNYKSILPDKRYRFFPCVQTSVLFEDGQGSCTAFLVDAEQFADGAAEYDVSVQGVLFPERYVPRKSPYFGEKIATPLAGSCETVSSTTGTRAGAMWVIMSLLLLVRLA